MNLPKILVIDIETRPAVAYVWRMFKENISPDQVIEPGGTICFGAKWVGQKEVFFYSDWQHGHIRMLLEAHKLLSEADAVITYNGDKFDISKLNGEFLMAGLKPPPPPTSIDLLKTVRKFGFDMNRLAFIGPLLRLGDKVKHEGFSLWVKVLGRDKKAEKRMEKYCKQDVVLTERLYNKIKPFIRNHPHLGETGTTACGSCGGNHLQSRGYRRTRAFKIQRLQCQTCGSWQDGKRTKL